MFPEQLLHPRQIIPEILPLNSTNVCRVETLPHPPAQPQPNNSENESPALSFAADEMPLDSGLLEIISARLKILLQVFVGNQAKGSNILSDFSKSFVARQTLQTGNISLLKRHAQHSLGT